MYNMEIKSLPDGLNSRMEGTKKRMSELENRIKMTPEQHIEVD